ncbi:hypothetical protein [Roseimicrobium sp. ORNL1]|uniref:hypothetical protein n=1 Tax=Roseimicrobium sp. ORNL1 TaxID=2711231 RepID=UPI0013E11ACB|nr:hypothetical protein [Roseimicrobium sp. ORNL1]QIF01953.1 hypothetical protein G5S37_10570 [Roseimicrobium sp. ORNL1]
MSRRTKLLITLLFLVLLAIPAVYVALTWSPVNPLRIRIAPAAGRAPLPIEPLGYYVLPIEVENTSSTTVHLMHVSPSISPPSSTSRGDSAVELPFLLNHIRSFSIVIPPHSTVPAHLTIYRKDLAIAELNGSLWAKYGWVSIRKATTMRFMEWIGSFPPGSWCEPVPHPRPDYDSVPVEFPKGTAASFGISLEPTSGFEGRGPLSR